MGVPRIFLLLVATLCAPLPGNAQNLSVVSAASYLDSIAPDSWAAAFGSNFILAADAVIGQLGPDGQFPTKLAGVTVAVHGEPARVYFVSRGQINFLVPFDVAPGLATVVVTSQQVSSTFRGRVQVLRASPGLFSKDASGQGPGSIINGVTYDGEPFAVQTPENVGEDKRTRLAIYGTGFRFAEDLTAILRAPDGRQFRLNLEYSGPAPGFFGLDQANLVLPAEFDIDGSVSVALSTPEFTSNEVTFLLQQIPAASVGLAGFSLARETVVGGDETRGVVRLNGRARGNGKPVQLSTPSILVKIPKQVVVPEGEVEAEFPIETSAPIERTNVEIRAQAGSVTKQVTLAVETRSAVMISAVELGPQTVAGGGAGTGTIQLRDALAAGSIRVVLTSSRPNIVAVPESVVILAGQRSAQFLFSTISVNEPVAVTITAAVPGSENAAVLNVRPPVTISASPSSLVGGGPVDLEIRLAEPAPVGGAIVELRSSSVSLILPAPTVTIPALQDVTTVRVNTIAVIREEEVVLQAGYAGFVAEARVTVKPAESSALASLALNPRSVPGGGSVTGTVTLTGPAPAGLTIVELRNDNGLAIFRMPTQVNFTAGESVKLFTIETNRVVFDTQVTITARLGGETKQARLTVTR